MGQRQARARCHAGAGSGRCRHETLLKQVDQILVPRENLARQLCEPFRLIHQELRTSLILLPLCSNLVLVTFRLRSEERRVGKECRL